MHLRKMFEQKPRQTWLAKLLPVSLDMIKFCLRSAEVKLFLNLL